MPGFTELGELAQQIGVVSTLLIFVVFVQATVIFTLFRMLNRREKTQAAINERMVDFLMLQKESNDQGSATHEN